jgi:hypothetical protein
VVSSHNKLKAKKMRLDTYGTKIINLSSKVSKLQEKNKASNKESRRLRSRLKEVLENRSYWKERCKAAESCPLVLSNTASASVVSAVEPERISRHQFNTLMVRLCVSIYLSGSCGLRSALKIVKCMCLISGLELGKIPSKSTLENWLKKLGYSVYEQSGARYTDVSYGLIIDESLVIGQEKLLVILGIRAQKTESGALCHSELELLYMGVESTWTGLKVAEAIAKVTEKEGKKAAYVVSDKGSILCKGIKDAGLTRIADVGHEIARLTERQYEKGDLAAFTVAASLCKTKYIMTDMAYLLCPKQRKMARFMNLNSVFEWGKNILTNFDRLTEKEKETFDWVKAHQNVIKELSYVFETTKKVLEIIKNEGLSYDTINRCLEICGQSNQDSTAKSDFLMQQIKSYLEEERKKLPDEKTIWYASSDIIESLFGTVKSKQASNPLHGVTSAILFLPLMTKIGSDNPVLNMNIKQAMQGVYMSDLEQWNKDYLIENQVVRRNKILKK